MANDNDKLGSVMLMSDEELFEKLQEHGFSAGPIVDSTRSVYQRKLAKILEDGYVAPPDYGCSSEEERSDTEEHLRQRIYRYISSESPLLTSGSPSTTFLKKNLVREEPKSANARHTVGAKESSAPGFSKVKILIFMVVTVILIVLLYQNMEGSEESNPVPRIEE